MKKLSMLFGVFSILFLGGIASAITYTCDSCDSCNALIASASPNDFIQLNSSLYSDVSGCISDVGISDIGIDCNGYEITSSVGVFGGINIQSASNITVSNCSMLAGWDTGVFLWDGNYVTVENCTFYGDTNGFHIYGGNYNDIRNNNITGTDIAVLIEAGNQIIENNSIKYNNNGIAFYSGGGNIFRNNIIEGQFVAGTYIIDGGNYYYNNLFNNTVNVIDVTANSEFWNTTKVSYRNIFGGANICGNYWAYPNGTGYSETCTDTNLDGICDSAFMFDASNVDNLPLSSYIGNGIFECGSCSECNALLSSAISGDIIRLNTSLSIPSGSCVIMNAVIGVTFDCQGNTITSSGYDGDGIAIAVGSYNTSVINCIVSGFDFGFHDYSSSFSTWSHVNATGNNYGMEMGESDGTRILSSVFNYNTYFGTDLQTSSNIFMSNVTAHGNGLSGIGMGYETGINTIENTNSYSNGQNGFSFWDVDDSISRNITSDSNAEYGIYFDGGSTNNTVEHSITVGNGLYGLVFGITGANTENNIFYDNILNNTQNVFFADDSIPQIWNVMETYSINIMGGNHIGGNFWAYPNGTGYSQTCINANGDNFCDNPYSMSANNNDFLPLVMPPPLTIMILSPQNTTYSITNIPLQVFANGIVNTWWYSLNGGANIGFFPNITIIGIQGNNSIFVYASNSSGYIAYANMSFVVNATASSGCTGGFQTTTDSVSCASNNTLQHNLNTIECCGSICYNYDNTQSEICQYGCANNQCKPAVQLASLSAIGIALVLLGGIYVAYKAWK
jgi:parallel beta-helix repeat protein